MWLVAGGKSHRLAQAAPDFVIPSRSEPILAGPATLVVQVDGVEDRNSVRIVGRDECYPDRLLISRDVAAPL